MKLFNDADQDRIKTDLTIYFGPRAEHYVHTYEKMRAKNRGFPLTWSWPVFFGTFVWFFYRKMYLWGAGIIVVPFVIGILFPNVNGGAWIGLALFAKNVYVQAALSRILKADELALFGNERAEYLRQAGGVSLTAGILAGLLFGAILAAVIWLFLADPQALR